VPIRRKAVGEATSPTTGRRKTSGGGSGRLVAWAQVGATVFAGLAVISGVVSIQIQYSQFRADEAIRTQDQTQTAAKDALVFASRVSIWPASLGMNLADKRTQFDIVIQNGSPVALTRVGMEFDNAAGSKTNTFVIVVGVIVPCTRLTVRVPKIGPPESAPPMPDAIFFDDPRGSWRLDTHAHLAPFPHPYSGSTIDNTVDRSEVVEGCSTSV
jgi:hypothetical protein